MKYGKAEQSDFSFRILPGSWSISLDEWKSKLKNYEKNKIYKNFFRIWVQTF